MLKLKRNEPLTATDLKELERIFLEAGVDETALDRESIWMELVIVTVTSSIQYFNPSAPGSMSVSKFSPCRTPSGLTKILEPLGITAAAGLIKASYKDSASGLAVWRETFLLSFEPGSGTSGFTNGEGFTGLRRELWTARQQCVSGSGSAQGEIAETCNAMLRGYGERPAQSRAAFQRQCYTVAGRGDSGASGVLN